MLLAIFSIITIFTYPLAPTQVSLISMFNIGVPAFLLSLETNTAKKNQNFLKKTILTALPASLTSFSAIACLWLYSVNCLTFRKTILVLLVLIYLLLLVS